MKAQQHLGNEFDDINPLQVASMNNPNILDVINTLSAAVGAGAIFFAGLTIKANKRLAQELRRIELAENLIVISSNVEDAFRHIRSQYNRIPRENVGNEEYHLQRRFDVIREYNPLFNELRDAQIRARTVLESDVCNEDPSLCACDGFFPIFR